VVLRAFERRLERLVDGAFARAFRSGLRPVELGRRLVREMDDNRTVGVSGRTVVPNAFVIQLAPSDAAAFAEVESALAAELCDAVRDHARSEGYGFMGPITVSLAADPAQRPGTFVVDARLRQGEGGAGPGSLVLESGRRIALGAATTRIGRLPECEVQLADTNVSRVHAEVRAAGEGYLVVDLGSTNGTKVNGARIGQHPLRDGDEILVGVSKIVFQAS